MFPRMVDNGVWFILFSKDFQFPELRVLRVLENRSPVKGLFWNTFHRDGSRYRAEKRFSSSGKSRALGTFDSAVEAAVAYALAVTDPVSEDKGEGEAGEEGEDDGDDEGEGEGEDGEAANGLSEPPDDAPAHDARNEPRSTWTFWSLYMAHQKKTRLNKPLVFTSR